MLLASAGLLLAYIKETVEVIYIQSNFMTLMIFVILVNVYQTVQWSTNITNTHMYYEFMLITKLFGIPGKIPL